MRILPTAVTFARRMAYLGLACGVLYAVGGLVLDLLTIGVNRGTALAFLAIAGMPILFAAAGFVAGLVTAFVSRGVRAARGASHP